MRKKVQFQSGKYHSFVSFDGTGVKHDTFASVFTLPGRWIALTGLFLAFCLVSHVAYADDAATLAAQINGFAHGGTGTLTASATGNEVAVTGTVTGATATLLLDIDPNVTVKWGASLEGSTASGIALINITGFGTFEVITGGKIEQTGTDGNALYQSGTGPIIVSGGTMISTTGSAISGTSGTTVIVNSGTVSTTTGAAIYAENVIVSGTGEVRATDDGSSGGNAIASDGSIEVKDNASVSATSGNAIFAFGANSTVTVSGGEVTNNPSVWGSHTIFLSDAFNTGNNVFISGTGKVKALGSKNAINTLGNVIMSGGEVSATTGYAISAEGDVTVGGTGKVMTTDDGSAGGTAISAHGNVEVKDNALVSATLGSAIHAEGANSTVTISGGEVTNNTALSQTILLSDITNTGNNVLISGTGKVKALGAYDAISTLGNVIMSGGEVSATTGIAIGAYVTGSVIVSGGTVSVTAGTAIDTDGTVTVSGTGEVKATGNDGNAIVSHGNVEIKDNAIVSATTGRVIYVYGANSTVSVSGGTVTTSGNFYPAIYMTVTSSGTPGNLTISGTGKIQSLDNADAILTTGNVIMTGGEVSAATGIAIYGNSTLSTITVSGGLVKNNSSSSYFGAISCFGDVEIKDDAIVSATYDHAIDAGGTVTVSGGFVFAYGTAMTDVINNGSFTAPTGTGVVVAWDEAQGNTTYVSNSETDLAILPANGARWMANGTEGGIGYATGGFFEIAGVNVTLQPITTVYTLTLGTFTGGSVTAAKSGYAENESVTLTISPESGYELDTIAAYRTGASDTPVALTGTGNTRIFTMPAYGVTVTAAFKKTQAQWVDDAKSLVEAASFAVPQATANTEGALITWLIQYINALSGTGATETRSAAPSPPAVRTALPEISAMGITVTAADITIIEFVAAIPGTESVPAGVNGSFTFTVTLTLGAATLTTDEVSGVIAATPYAATSIELVNTSQAKGLNVSVQDGILHISGLTIGKPWRIYTTSGLLIYHAIADSDKATVSLPVRGVYIITSDENAVKTVY